MIDLRELVLDFGEQRVITKDKAMVTVDAVLFYKITDPKLAMLAISDLPYTLELLTKAALRDVLSQITVDESLSQRERINAMLMERLFNLCRSYGVDLTRVEIQSFRYS